MTDQHPDDPRYEADIAPYRQPMVTSIGIIMGFMLNFLANWAVTDDDQSALQTPADWIVAGSIMASMILFAVVLYRLLDNRLSPQGQARRYAGTFRLYMAALVVAFTGFALGLVL